MKIDVVISHEYVNDDMLDGKEVIIIDTLRATSVIVTAMMNGAFEIFPVKEIDEAIDIKSKLNISKEVLLGGERLGLKIAGFDLSNSPLEYKKEIVSGKTIVMTTTNGTKTMEKCSKADEIIIGSLLNSKATALKAMESKKDIVIVNSGTRGKFTTDDFITAGAIIRGILDENIDVELTDLADTARMIYDFNPGVKSALINCLHYNYLNSIGLQKDTEYCITENLTDVVPILKNSRISL